MISTIKGDTNKRDKKNSFYSFRIIKKINCNSFIQENAERIKRI